MPAKVELLGGREVRTGRRRDERESLAKNLQFADYTRDMEHYIGLPRYVHHGYGISPEALPMYRNDQFGDCTCAALGHMAHVWTIRDGRSPARPPAEADVLSLYWATGHPDTPGSDDNGRMMRDVLDYWRGRSLPSMPSPLAYVAIDPSNSKQVRTAIYLFGGVYVGLWLPRAAQQMATWEISSATKLTGDFEPGSWGGHAINLMSYDPSRVEYGGVTWGARVGVGQSFLHAYCDEMYAVIHPSWLEADESPEGFDLDSLRADLEKLRQH